MNINDDIILVIFCDLLAQTGSAKAEFYKYTTLMGRLQL